MFCGKCGNQINSNERFCSRCGSMVSTSNEPGINISTTNFKNTVPENQGFQKNAPLKNKRANNKTIGIIASICLLLVFSIILTVVISSIGGSGYKKTLNNYFKAIEKNDADLMYSSVVAKYWIEYIEKGSGESYAYEFIQESIDDDLDNYEHLGDNLHITYKITEEKHASKVELEDLKDNIYDWYAYFIYDDMSEMKITDAYLVYVDFTVSGKNGSEDFNYPDGLLLIKENGKWKITRGYLDNSFYENS